MLDLVTIKARAAIRLATPATLAIPATLATDVPLRQFTTSPTSSQVAAVATVAKVPEADAINPDRWCWPHSEAMTGAELALMAHRLAYYADDGMGTAEAEAKADRMMRFERHGLAPEGAAPTAPLARTCATCSSITRRNTCADPEGAGLVESFGIVFIDHLPADQAAHCPAYCPSLRK